MFDDLKTKLENIPSTYYIVGGVAFIGIVWFLTRSSGGQTASGTTPSADLSTALGQLSDAVDQVQGGGGSTYGSGSNGSGSGSSDGFNPQPVPAEPFPGGPTQVYQPPTSYTATAIGKGGGGIVQLTDSGRTGSVISLPKGTTFTVAPKTIAGELWLVITSGKYAGYGFHASDNEWLATSNNPATTSPAGTTSPNASNSPYGQRVLIVGENNVLPRIQSVTYPVLAPKPASTLQTVSTTQK